MNLRVERYTVELGTGEFMRNERYPAKATLHLQSIGVYGNSSVPDSS